MNKLSQVFARGLAGGSKVLTSGLVVLSPYSTHTATKTPVPLKQPLNWPKDVKLTKVVESKEDFKHVLKLLPEEVVPEPPKHASYPTPSGWCPPNYEKAKKLPYAVLRTRFHNYPIYVLEREGGNRKLVRVKYIQGNIWQFDKDLRQYIEAALLKTQNKKLNVYSQVNEVQRQVLVKGHHQDIISQFLLECGF